MPARIQSLVKWDSVADIVVVGCGRSRRAHGLRSHTPPLDRSLTRGGVPGAQRLVKKGSVHRFDAWLHPHRPRDLFSYILKKTTHSGSTTVGWVGGKKDNEAQAGRREDLSQNGHGECPLDPEELCPATFGDRNHKSSKSIGPRACQEKEALFSSTRSCASVGRCHRWRA